MIKVTKKVDLTGVAYVGDKPVVQMSASLNSDNAGNTSYTEFISDKVLYAENVIEMRKDISKFKEQVYLIEDDFLVNGNPLDETKPALPEVPEDSVISE